MDGEQATGQRQISARSTEPQPTKDQPVTLALDDAPAGAAQARVDAEDTD